MKMPKTPPSEDLFCAADWVDACLGEDEARLKLVSDWLRAKAEKQRDKELRAQGEIR